MSFRDRADPIVSLFGCRDRVKGDSNWLLVIIGWIRRSGNSGAMMEMGKPGDQLVCWGGADGGDGQGRQSLCPYRCLIIEEAALTAL